MTAALTLLGGLLMLAAVAGCDYLIVRYRSRNNDQARTGALLDGCE
jgi:hypothetical protein